MSGRLWLLVGICAAAAAILYFACFGGAPESPEQDRATTELIESHKKVVQDMRLALEKTAHERDSVLRLSDARGDTMQSLRRSSDALGDSLEAMIGRQPTYTMDSAACNVALRLSLRQRDIIANERDVCAVDRASLRQQLVRDSTEHRQQITALLFRLDTTTTQLLYERHKPRPCRVDLLVAKPKCGPVIGATGALGLIVGLLN